MYYIPGFVSSRNKKLIQTRRLHKSRTAHNLNRKRKRLSDRLKHLAAIEAAAVATLYTDAMDLVEYYIQFSKGAKDDKAVSILTEIKNSAVNKTRYGVKVFRSKIRAVSNNLNDINKQLANKPSEMSIA